MHTHKQALYRCGPMWSGCALSYKANIELIGSAPEWFQSTSTIHNAKAAHHDHLQAAFNPLREVPVAGPNAAHVKWCPPVAPAVKLNSDGAFLEASHRAAFAVVARNASGEVLEINYGRIRASSALAVKAWAARIACTMAKAANYRSAIIESDSANLINLLGSAQSLDRWEIKPFFGGYC